MSEPVLLSQVSDPTNFDLNPEIKAMIRKFMNDPRSGVFDLQPGMEIDIPVVVENPDGPLD